MREKRQTKWHAGYAILLITVAGVFAFSVVTEALSFSLPFTLPFSFGFSKTHFGGRIIDKEDCDSTCGGPGGTLIEVGSPRGGKFIKTSSTKVYEFNNLDKRNWVLGTASGNNKTCYNLEVDKSDCFFFGRCEPQCEKKGEGKEIEIMGTSDKP